MKSGDAAALLIVAAEQMQRAVDWLRLSYEKCRPWMDASDFSIEQAEAAEAFSSRFARTVDMYANKALRALDTFELAEPGSLLDALHRAEKRGIIDSVEDFRAMKLLRNSLAHDYAGESLPEMLRLAVEMTPQLMEAAARWQAYCQRVLKRDEN